jgi:EamA-like transporter family
VSCTCLLAALSYAVSYVYMARYLAPRNFSPVVLSAAQLVAATGWTLLALAWSPGPVPAVEVRPWLALAALGILGTGAAYVINYALIRTEGAAGASVVTSETVKLVETSGGGFLVRLLFGLDCGRRLVDPDLGWHTWGFGAAVEPLGVGGVGGTEDLSAAGLDLDCGAVVHGGRGVIADAGMAVFVVVVAEENLAEGAGILEGAEVAGERRAVF